MLFWPRPLLSTSVLVPCVRHMCYGLCQLPRKTRLLDLELLVQVFLLLLLYILASHHIYRAQLLTSYLISGSILLFTDIVPLKICFY